MKNTKKKENQEPELKVTFNQQERAYEITFDPSISPFDCLNTALTYAVESKRPVLVWLDGCDIHIDPKDHLSIAAYVGILEKYYHDRINCLIQSQREYFSNRPVQQLTAQERVNQITEQIDHRDLERVDVAIELMTRLTPYLSAKNISFDIDLVKTKLGLIDYQGKLLEPEIDDFFERGIEIMKQYQQSILGLACIDEDLYHAALTWYAEWEENPKNTKNMKKRKFSK